LKPRAASQQFGTPSSNGLLFNALSPRTPLYSVGSLFLELPPSCGNYANTWSGFSLSW
jgi:hypothetical protein